MVRIEINGKQFEVEQGSMIIEAADAAGIRIPRFCYHKKLSIAANCRMCLVDVENARKPVPACATPVTDGMKIDTRSKAAIEAQKAVMEFLLINHPLDCPICDQGGECELQDVAMGYGSDVSQFSEGKRVVRDQNIGPLIATDMTRCIHCTRCVRFGTEIAGIRELGALGRGEHMAVSTFIEHSIGSEVSANVIDVCPVGALTSKPFRFSARTWELRQRVGIGAHDCLGSNLFAHIKDKKIKRVVPKENEAINEVWLSDRDRFSYQALASEQRLLEPMIKVDGQWQTVDWATALEQVVSRLKQIAGQYSPDQIGGLAHPSATTEEFYLLQKWLRGIGVSHLDHRLRTQDFSDQQHVGLAPGLSMSIEDLAQLEAALLIGANVRKEQPIAALRLRAAAVQGAQIASVSPINFDTNFEQSVVIQPEVDQWLLALAKIAASCAQQKNSVLPTAISAAFPDLRVDEASAQIARQLIEGQRAAVILGSLALHHPQAAKLRALAAFIAEQTGGVLSLLPEGANSVGAWQAGFVPHRGPAGYGYTTEAKHAAAMIAEPLKAYVLFALEPEYDCADSAAAMAAMTQADCVISFSAYDSESLRQYADVLLPIATAYESSGSFVNAAGEQQSFEAIVPAPGQARPGWKVLRVLGNLFELADFDYLDSQQVMTQLAQRLTKQAEAAPQAQYDLAVLEQPEQAIVSADQLLRLGGCALYGVDGVVRRAAALNDTTDAKQAQMITLHPQLAEQLGVGEGQCVMVSQDNNPVQSVLVRISTQVPTKGVWLAEGTEAALGLGLSFSPLSVTV